MGNKENWVQAFGLEGFYEVSDLGNVRRIGKSSGARIGRILKPFTSMGYQVVYPCINCEYKDCYVHRLVLQSFTTTHGECVNHKNGVRNDNRLENLEWCTMQENLLHATRQLGKRRGVKHWNSRITPTIVKKIRKLYASGEYRQIDLADQFGLSRPQVSQIINRRSWSHVE
jgi:antitoxin component HigA of HigAB toxin-antitoxin module